MVTFVKHLAAWCQHTENTVRMWLLQSWASTSFISWHPWFREALGNLRWLKMRLLFVNFCMLPLQGKKWCKEIISSLSPFIFTLTLPLHSTMMVPSCDPQSSTDSSSLISLWWQFLDKSNTNS